MSLVVQRQDTQESLTLAFQPFASGGEGELYAVTAPPQYTDQVVKVYHPPKRDAEHLSKLKYLLANKPSGLSHDRYAIVWPTATVAVQGEFVGYMMPRAEGEKLEVLCAGRLPAHLDDAWQHFRRDRAASIAARLGVSAALAAAVQVLHDTQRYVLVDLKPDNLLVRSDGRIAIVDIDSMQVADEGGVYHLARVATPEYAPPEYFQGVRPTEVSIIETWDRYSLAVIIYKVLCGIHPFAGTAHAPYDAYVNLQDKILHGLFVHAPVPEVAMRVVPPPHRKYHELPAALQQLWLRCFNYGHQHDYERPSAQEWSWQLAVPDGRQAVRPLPSSYVVAERADLPVALLPSTGLLTASDIPRPAPVPNFLPQPLPFQGDRRLSRMAATASGGLLLASVVVLKGLALVSGLFIVGAIAMGSLGVLYRLDPAVKIRRQRTRQLRRLANERRIQRRKVLGQIQRLQRMPSIEQELIPVLQSEQEALQKRHARALQEELQAFKERLRRWDRSVIQLNRQLITALQQLNGRLSANLWDAVGAEAESLPRSVRAMPLPKLAKWLTAADPNDVTLAAIRRKAEPLLAEYQSAEKELLQAQEATYQQAMAAADRARKAYEERIAVLKSATTTSLDRVLQEALADEKQHMQQYLEMQQSIKVELEQLKALYAESDALESELSRYRALDFKKYLNRII